MIQCMNGVVNRILKALWFLTLIVVMLVWSVCYPFLRMRMENKKIVQNEPLSISDYPSFVLWMWYNKTYFFFERFIFKNKIKHYNGSGNKYTGNKSHDKPVAPFHGFHALKVFINFTIAKNVGKNGSGPCSEAMVFGV